jgi:hypothetical protein
VANTKIGLASISILIIPLVLVAYTHFLNPIGFPSSPLNDENIYLRRAMRVLNGLGVEESVLFDHPYFSQLFLAGVFFIIGYPNSLHPIVGDLHSVEALYLIPRILMGIFAVIDTFLIYKISELYKNRRVALVASVIFAVMPIVMWLNRWVILESIQLPFLLGSVLFALYLRRQKQNLKSNRKNILLVLLSGIFIGLAIFTKIPVFTLIPLVGYLVYTNSNKSFRLLGLWLVPVILIPMVWPAYAFSVGQLDKWIRDVFHQTQRGANNTFFYSLNYNFNIDPTFHILGVAGLIFSIIRRSLLILLWVVPFLIFLYLVGFVSFYRFAPIFPALSIAIAILIVDVSDRIRREIIVRMLPYAVIFVIGTFGLVSSTTLIVENDYLPYLKTTAFLSWYLHENIQRTTVIGNPFYLWMPEFVFHLNQHQYIGFYDGKPAKFDNVLSIADRGLIDKLRYRTGATQIQSIQENSNLYHTEQIATFGNEGSGNQITIYHYFRKLDHYEPHTSS